jgi:hypothetical protein
MIQRLVIAITLVALAASGAPAKTVRASDPDRKKFQDAIEMAAYGDTVLVAPGTYEGIRLRPGIRLVSEKGPEVTTIRGQHRYVIHAPDSDSLNVIDGFTLDGVRACESIILLEKSPMTVKNCVLKHGWAGIHGNEADIRASNLKISDCQYGYYLLESKGEIIENDIRRCVTAIHLISSNPRILRSVITGNSLGIEVTEHSDPQIGGSLASANKIFGNPGGAIKNQAYAKEEEFRTIKPLKLRAAYNFWGSNCPDSMAFRGPVSWVPWVDETAKKSLDRCAPGAAPAGR